LVPILHQLWANWMFRLSLSSNELFHSNTLQFLAEASWADAPVTLPVQQEPGDGDGNGSEAAPAIPQPQVVRFEAAQRLLALFTEDAALVAEVAAEMQQASSLRVVRELQNMDLAVIDGDARVLFAVELKVKSYPNPTQLLQYAQAAAAPWGGQFVPPLFLLSLVDADAAVSMALAETAVLPRILAVDFGDVAGRLARLQVVERLVPVRDEYAALCSLLHQLAGQLVGLLHPGMTLLQAQQVSDALTRYRLHAIWGKLWTSYAASLMRQGLPAGVQVGHAYTKSALVDAYWEGLGGANQRLAIGVQLQGGSPRLFLTLRDPAYQTRARWAAERALLQACAGSGLFRTNPRYGHYHAYWLHAGGQGWNADVVMPDPNAPVEIGRMGWPQPQAGQLPRLHGYGNGFAYFRLNPITGHTLAEIVELFAGVLVGNVYSEAAEAQGSILQRVIDAYVADPHGWTAQHVGPLV
jgi:integrase